MNLRGMDYHFPQEKKCDIITFVNLRVLTAQYSSQSD